MDQNPPETQFNQQPIPPQPSVAGIPSAESPQPFTITGPAQPIQQENPAAPPPIPEEFIQHPASETPVGTQFVTAQPAPEAQFAQPTVQPGLEAVPTPTSTPAPEAQYAQPPAQPVQEVPPSPAPWTETVAPIPTQQVVGLNTEAVAQTVTPNPSPDVAIDTQQAQALAAMAIPHAPLENNSGEELAAPTPEPVIAGADTNTSKTTENANFNLDSLFEKWKDLGPTELTLQFNSFMSNLRSKGSLDSSIEEGLVRAYSTLLLNKSGLTLEKDLEKKWD